MSYNSIEKEIYDLYSIGMVGMSGTSLVPCESHLLGFIDEVLTW